MGEQTFGKIKKTIAILLAVFFVLSITATAVTASPMKVAFKNDAGVELGVLAAFYDPNACHGSGYWHVRGWYVLEPGETKTAFYTTSRLSSKIQW